MKRKEMRKVIVSDILNWRIEEHKEYNKHATTICYRKHLDEALIVADESKNTINLYYEVMKHFKTLVEPQIQKSKTGESFIKYDNHNFWYSRNKDAIMKSFFEFILKKICLSDGVDCMESLKRVHNNEDFSSLEIIVATIPRGDKMDSS